MACYSVAVARAEMQCEHTVELLLGGEAAIQALVSGLVGLLGAVPTVTWNQARDQVAISTGRLTITIRRGTIAVTSYSLSRAQCDELAAQVTEIAKALAIPLAQERTAKAIEAKLGKYAISADQRVGAARVLKFKIPL